MRKVQLTKIEHRGQVRIKVDFPYDPTTILLIKSINGYKWSQTKKCWHLPYTKESYALLKAHFEISLSLKEKAKKDKENNLSIEQVNLPVSELHQSPPQQLVQVRPEHDFRVKVLIPFDRKDWVQKIKHLPDRAWNAEEKYWSVPKTKEIFQQLQQLFEEVLKVESSIEWNSIDATKPFNRVTPNSADSNNVNVQAYTNIPRVNSSASQKAFQTTSKDGRAIKAIVGQKIIIEKENKEWLRAFVSYDKKGWIAVMKNIAGRKWDSSLKFWLIPNVKESYRMIKNEIGLDNVSFRFKIPVDIPEYFNSGKRTIEKKTKKSFLEQLSNMQRNALIQLDERLLLERLSPSTRKSYKHHLAGLFFYFKDIAPESISLEQVQQYLLYKIRNKKIAESTQNQIINAVKAYWEKVLKRDKSFIEIPRPKKPKKLPNVLSMEEVVRLIDCVDNLKHKLILLLIYSAGLRLGEAVNLLCRDINTSRRHIHIKGGKGKKDRYVALAESVMPFLEEYKKQYIPKRWLFEGQHGGQYSKRSVQNILKKAVIKSRVNPYATVHTLRHSYATHCVENGHPQKAIQDALGHASPETTQIYLHLSSTALRKLKSPLDSLDIKKK